MNNARGDTPLLQDCDPLGGYSTIATGGNLNETRTEDDEIDAISQDAQAGVQQVEAIAIVWTRTDLIIAYILIWIVYFVMLMQQNTAAVLSPYITSDFRDHSLTPTVGILSSIIGGVCNLTVAKILDIFGRSQGYGLSLLIVSIGLVMMTMTASVEMYAAAQVFCTVGNSALLYSVNIFVSDTSSLHNRGLMTALTSSPNIVTTWLGGPISQAFLSGPGWRWCFGMFAIVVPTLCSPLLGLLVFNSYKARRQNLVAPQKHVRTLWQSLHHYFHEFDAVGLLLLSCGLAVLLLPFNLYTLQPDGWQSPLIICLLLFGVTLIVSFILWERFCARVTFMPYSLLLDRNMIGSCILGAVLFISYFCWNSFFSSSLQVVNGLSATEASYIVQIYGLGSSLFAIVAGLGIRYTGRFKFVTLFGAIPVYALSMGLMIYFREPNGNIGYIIMCQVFISLAAGIIMITPEIAALSIASHQHIAVVLAIVSMFSSIGGAMGYTIAGIIWQSTFPSKLALYLPEEEMPNLMIIYGSLEIQLNYAIGTPARLAIQQAYADTQAKIHVAGTAIWALGFIALKASMASLASEAASKPPRKRRRPTRSCQECRRRKVKCDLEQPCAQCVATKCVCFYELRPALNQAAAVGATPWQSIGPGPQQPASFNSTGLAEQFFPSQHISHAMLPIQRDKRPLEDEVTSLTRRISAIEEHLTSPKLKQNDPGRSFAQSALSLSLSSKSWADQMAQLYVTRFESAFRILHIPSFWAEYEEFWKNPELSPMALQCKVKLVIAIGSSLYRDAVDADKIRLSSSQWVHEAQTWVSGSVKKDRISLGGLQVQCLLILARQVLSIGADLVWIAVGTLVRTAMHISLHRDPTHFKTMTVLYASLDSGAPLAISFDDFDTNSPQNVDDKDISESTETLPDYAENTATDKSFQLLLLRYLRPRCEIIRRMNGASSSFTQDEVQSLTSTLNKACRECSARLVGNNDGDTTGVFKHNIADLLLRRFLLTLYRPLATASRVGDPGFHFSRKVCLESATALLSPPHNSEFYQVAFIGGGIFKNRIIHASLAICSDLIIDMEELNSVEWPSTYRKMLLEALREAARQTNERIRLGETNLRLNMKLNVVLCRAQCAESGSARQLRMIEGAQESLKMAYAVMQARLSLTDEKQQEEGRLERSELDWQNIGTGVDKQWDEYYDMPDIGLDELLWLGLGESGITVPHEAD
ncbi:major facilitator superfamily domain-containing protein [Trichoderma austrokoningii]